MFYFSKFTLYYVKEQLTETRDKEIRSTFHSVHLKGLLSICIGLRAALQIIIKVSIICATALHSTDTTVIALQLPCATTYKHF